MNPGEVLPASIEDFVMLCNLSIDLQGTTSLDGCFQTINPAFERTLGYSLQELLAQPLLDFVHPDDRSQTGAELEKMKQEAATFTNRYRCKSGEYKWLEWTAVANRDRVYFTARDVTKRQQQQEAALRQLAEIETIYRSAPIGLSVLDTDLRFVRINQRLAEMNGLPVEEHLGRTVRELLPELADTAEALLRPVLETGEPLLNVEIRGETPAQPGVERIWLEHFLPLKEGDRVVGISIVCEEVTDRKQMEEALRESEERFRTMADNAPVMIWVTDPTGYCTYLSRSWYEFTGQTEETGLGFGWLDRTHPDDRPTAERLFLDANQQQVAFQLEYRLQNKNGDYVWSLDAASPWFGRDGQFKGYIGSVIDISDRKQAEQEREQLLQREQTARETAEQANRIKDEFLAVLSHELRSPLNPILGWAKLLKAGNLDATKTAQALNIIERNAKLQSELIEDLLDVSRILQGKLRLNVTPIHLATTIRSAIETVRLAAEAKSIAIETHLDESTGQVAGDSTRLQQVVWNLLSNAVKFTPTGGQVAVSLVEVDGQAQITVSDNGKGIPANFLPHVFDYFRQEDGATTRKFGGLGLGLAIVRHLVELHGGMVQAESRGEGLGATFIVKLPLMAVQGTPDLDRLAPELPLNLNGVRVLVVDDEIDSREFVAFVLEQAGASVTTAATAAAGFLAFMQSPPDVLLSDIGMPDMDGYELIRQVRSHSSDQAREIPAIALTAYAGELNQQKALEAGFQTHLSKPIEPDLLVRAIVGLLGKGIG
jgi:PAS domain S-box-containing protein